MRERHPSFPFYGSRFKRLCFWVFRLGVALCVFIFLFPRHVEGAVSLIFHSDVPGRDYTTMPYGGGIVVSLCGARPDVTYSIHSILVSFLHLLFRTVAGTLLTVSESLSDTLLMLPAAEAPSWRLRVTSLSLFAHDRDERQDFSPRRTVFLSLSLTWYGVQVLLIRTPFELIISQSHCPFRLLYRCALFFILQIADDIVRVFSFLLPSAQNNSLLPQTQPQPIRQSRRIRYRGMGHQRGHHHRLIQTARHRHRTPSSLSANRRG